jgi:hypothetical protein
VGGFPPPDCYPPDMKRKDLITLIDAYADAKASRNHHLVTIMISQLERAVREIFPDETDEEGGAPEAEF